MNAEIVAIGDELTSGQRVDTNSAWLSQQLGEIGIRVLHHSTVADDLASCRDVFEKAFTRVDLVISTGGLGPTADDLTREVIADAMGVELVQDASALAHIRGMFESRGREMPPNNVVQAMFPAGSRVVPNPHGTAPGIDVTVAAKDGSNHKARCFALPGVPAEMKEMWNETVLPALLAAGAARRMIIHHELKCFGIGESDCERRLPDLVRRGRQPTVGITVHQATITLRISAEAENEAACKAQIQPTVDTIRECLGPIVFGEGNVTLHQVVLEQLRDRGQSLVTAEWGTVGVLAGWLSEASVNDLDEKQTYQGGLVCDGENHGASMREADLCTFAQQQREKAAADYALVIGDWHLPTQNSDSNDPPQQLFLVMASEADTISTVIQRTSHPDIVIQLAAKRGLDLLRKCLSDDNNG